MVGQYGVIFYKHYKNFRFMYKLKNYLKLVNIYNIQSKKENISPIIQITKILMKKSKNVWFKLKWLPILTKRCINVSKGNF